MSRRIPIEDMEKGATYRLQSRNLAVGVWNPDTQGFIGIRQKFGDHYLFTEIHWDASEHFGTASPTGKLAKPHPDISVCERFGDWCEEHHEIITWNTDARCWEHTRGNAKCGNPQWLNNGPLFEWLRFQERKAGIDTRTVRQILREEG